MDAKYYDRGEISIGNPPLVDLVRKLGSKDLPETEPTTLSAMAYEIARGVLGQRPIIQKIEIRLVHFSKGLETKDESEDNHVVNRSSSTQSAMILCPIGQQFDCNRILSSGSYSIDFEHLSVTCRF